MKKKIVGLFLFASMAFFVIACGSNGDTKATQVKETPTATVEAAEEVTETPTTTETDASTPELSESPTEEPTQLPTETANTSASNTSTQDGITITVTGCQLEPYDDSEGEFTQRLVMNYSVKNDTDKAFGYSPMGWKDATLPDGYKLESWMDLMDMDLKQVPSHGEATGQAYFLIAPGVNVNDFTVSYQFTDYNETFWDDFGKMISGEMGEEDYLGKYGNIPVLNFSVSMS